MIIYIIMAAIGIVIFLAPLAGFLYYIRYLESELSLTQKNQSDSNTDRSDNSTLLSNTELYYAREFNLPTKREAYADFEYALLKRLSCLYSEGYSNQKELNTLRKSLLGED